MEFLDRVLDATRDLEEQGRSKHDSLARLEGFEALVAWLELSPGDDVPGREAVLAQLETEIAWIDVLIGRQVDAILEHTALAELEARWRGLRRLVEGVQDPADPVKFRLLDVSWPELVRDAERAMDFDQSQFFRKVYSLEFGSPGGEPYGVLLGDYRIRHRPGPGHSTRDVEALRSISEASAAAFAPFIAGADPALFGLDAFSELERPMDLEAVFRGDEYAAWRRLRERAESRFLGLVLPRVLVREAYRDDPSAARGFRYVQRSRSGDLFGTAVFAFGEVLVRTFLEHGWMANIRGVVQDSLEGGLLPDLPHGTFGVDRRAGVSKGSLDVRLSDDQEKALSELGFIPLSHCHGTGFAAFYGNASVQRVQAPSRPKSEDATLEEVNRQLSSMLQYVFCVSRFAHYVKVIARDLVGSTTRPEEIERILNDWLLEYAIANESATSDQRARFPLREGRVEVKEVPGKHGVYTSVVHLRPHYQLDQLAPVVKLETELIVGNF